MLALASALAAVRRPHAESSRCDTKRSQAPSGNGGNSDGGPGCVDGDISLSASPLLPHRHTHKCFAARSCQNGSRSKRPQIKPGSTQNRPKSIPTRQQIATNRPRIDPKSTLN